MRKAARIVFLLLLVAFGAAAIYGMRAGWFTLEAPRQTAADAPGGNVQAGAQEGSALRPTFDIVRAEPDGSVVMAGRSEPGWTVIVESDGNEVGRATADENGEWIIQPATKLSQGEHSLELSAKAPKGDKTLFSAQRLALSLSEPRGGQPLVALTEEGKATRVLQMPPAEANFAAPSQTGSQTTPAALDSATLTPPSLPSPAVSEAASRIGFASVDYEDAGEKSMLILNGHAQPGTRVMLYVDNELVGTANADATGSWSFSGNQQLAGGSHTLRADLVSANDPNTVLARAEVEFDRPTTQTALAEESKSSPIYAAEPPAIAPARLASSDERARQPVEDDLSVPKAVIVKRGDTLWQIAQRHYGDGTKYTQIFRNNRKQIRDPNWIYPNQRFDLPR